MARALIGGLVRSGHDAAAVVVSDPSDEQRRGLAEDFGIETTADNAAAAARCRVLVLAVKPQIMNSVLADIRPGLPAEALVISVAAGVTLPGLAAGLGSGRALIRCMPNTPALFGAGITGLCASADVSSADRALAERLLASAGQTVWIEDEALMDVVTAVSGSGPAYFFALTEWLAQAGINAGLAPEAAEALARQTAIGAGVMLAESSAEAGELRRRVTSPGGTTAAALNSLAADGLEAIIDRAVQAAVRRGRELGAQ